MFGICAFLLIVASFKFLESSAIFTDLSFFTMMTAGLAKQSSVISVALSKYPFLLVFLILPQLGFEGELVLVFPFAVLFLRLLSGRFLLPSLFFRVVVKQIFKFVLQF